MALAYLFFLMKWQMPERILTVVMLFTIPGFIVFEGYNASYFFYYSDLCIAVHGALYDEEFPVADQGLGYLYNCFSADTKAHLYNIRYKIYESAYLISNNTNYQKAYDDLMSKTLDSQFDCEIVTELVPKLEMDFCKESLGRMWDIVKLFIGILFAGLLLAIGTRRLEVLIWKRHEEIWSMIQNLEVNF